MTDTSGDRTTPHGADPTDQGPFPWRLWLTIGALALGYLVVVGVGAWFLADIAEAVAPVIGDDPLVQRLAGWAVWAVFLLPVALVFGRTARNRARGTATSARGRWATGVGLLVLSVPGVITFGGVGGSDDPEIDSALQVIGPDFAEGVLFGRFATVAVVFVFLGLVVARRNAISDSEGGAVAFLRTPAYAALLALAVSLVLALLAA